MKVVNPNFDYVAWDAWVAERPPEVQALCVLRPADRFYSMAHGQIVNILSYSEDGTVRVNVVIDASPIFFPREVFGVDPANLAELSADDQARLDEWMAAS